MLNKKAQSQIITTVLIILLVLAAVIIVWQVIQTSVQQSADQISEKTECFDVTMEVVSTDATSDNITVKRGSGSDDVNVTGYRIFVNGEQKNDVTADLGPVETDTYTISSGIEDGNEVYVAAKLESGAVCAESGTVTVGA